MKKLLLLLSLLFIGTTNVSASTINPRDYIKLTEEQFKKNEEVEIFSGTWIVGEDFNPGRYVISTDPNTSGNLFVYDKDDFPKVNEILGENDILNAVKTITVDLLEGDKVEAVGLNNVYLKPYFNKEMLKDELTTGHWIVGADIKEGNYTATAPENESGNLIVFDENYRLVVNEILGAIEDLNLGFEKVRLNLKDGYRIKISGLNKIILE